MVLYFYIFFILDKYVAGLFIFRAAYFIFEKPDSAGLYIQLARCTVY